MTTLTIPHEARHVYKLDSPVCAECGRTLSLIPVGCYSAHYKLDDDADSPAYDDPYAISGCSVVWPQDKYEWLSCSFECVGEKNCTLDDEKADRAHGRWMYNKALTDLRRAGRGEFEMKGAA